jgi:hypothetical protein
MIILNKMIHSVNRMVRASLPVFSVLWAGCSYSSPALCFDIGDTIKLGPEVALSFPQPIQIGAELYCTGGWILCSEQFKYYIDAGYFNYKISSSGNAIGASSVEGGLRYFPFSFPLFFSMGLGYRRVFGSLNMSEFKIDELVLATNANFDLSTFYFGPGLGWRVSVTERLFLSFEFGIQLAILKGGDVFLENRDTGQNSSNSEDLQINSGRALQRIAGLTIPRLTLVRFAMYF